MSTQENNKRGFEIKRERTPIDTKAEPGVPLSQDEIDAAFRQLLKAQGLNDEEVAQVMAGKPVVKRS